MLNYVVQVRLSPVLKLVPVGSLTLVLHSFTEAPYEPLGEASFRSVILKCAFLLALASAQRCGQYAALSVHHDCGSGCTLGFDCQQDGDYS